jgi:hypothetical protein
MGATFTRVKTWVAEILKFADLNAEFDNILNNLTPAGIDDQSSNAAAMQGVADPYPAGVLSLPTSLAGELQRLRYVIVGITGKTYWYEDPDTTIAVLKDILTYGQWIPQTLASLTHVGATQFSCATDKTTTFVQGLRVKATVTAGTIYGTVKTSSFSSVTTVTVDWDSGASDAGLSAISIGIITPSSNALAILPVLTKTDDYVLTKTDLCKTIYVNKATAVAITLPAATTIPSGGWYRIVNIGAGTCTVTGTVGGVVNPTLPQYGAMFVFTDEAVWNRDNQIYIHIPRVTTITSHATPTINTDNCDAVTITGQTENITSFTTNLTGNPVNFQKLIVRIKDNGTAHTISWGAKFVAKGVSLPSTTVATKLLTVGFIYDSVLAKWGCVAAVQEV